MERHEIPPLQGAYHLVRPKTRGIALKPQTTWGDLEGSPHVDAVNQCGLLLVQPERRAT